MPDIIVVGAGPAGVRAAETLVKAGLRPAVVDESARSGGQIYRRPPGTIERDPKALYGFEARPARAIHDAFDAIRDHIDYRPGASVWDVSGNKLHILARSHHASLRWDGLILATGAMDRVIPFPGWTLPGVFTLGGAQVALKHQACAIGARPVFLGTGPLLYLVAFQYAAAGVRPAAVLDTASAQARRKALPGLLAGGRTFLKGLYYVGSLRARGIPLFSDVRPLAAESGVDGSVCCLAWRDAQGRRRRTACDALAFGFGLKSEAQLADLCGVPFAFDRGQRQWLPVQDRQGRAAAEGVYLAGDGAGINGAAAAEIGGARAAHALLHDLGHAGHAEIAAALDRRLARHERFRAVLDAEAFPFPADLAAGAADDLVICRCEGVTAGAVRDAVRTFGAAEINRAKAVTRVGMGRCQGRVCGTAASEILADALGVPLETVGRLRGQAPVKPIPLAAFLDGAAP